MSSIIDPTEPAPWDVIRLAMVVGPVSGYFHQYYTMHKMKTSIGFSSVTCGVLIVSSNSITSRGNSRVGSPNTGSNQGSINVTTRASRQDGQGWYKEFATYWGVQFWNWPTIAPYFIFLAVFTVLVGLSLVIIGKTEFYVALLGLAALGIEATVPLPQAIQNYHSKSTAGFSPAILLMWVIGDSFKTYYYIKTGAKYQFVGCGIIQLCIDCVIITQTVIYSKYWKDAMRRGDGVFGVVSYSPRTNDYVGGATRSSSEALLGREDDETHS
ncbi:PQ-loop repeat-containing protein 1 [Entomortierella beljakovae]|nr:PQ-loop repeat-containing protein 1 [Entomortierella beljakovae]